MKPKITAVMLMFVLTVLCLSACAKSDKKTAETGAQILEEETTTAQTETVKEAAAETVSKPQEETGDEEAAAAKSEASGLIHFACVTIREGRNVGNDHEGHAYIRYPQFILYDDDAEKFPDLSKAFDELNSKYETEYLEHLTYSQKLGEEAVADGTDMTINFFDYLTPEIRRADSHIVSILENYDTYTGGVHGYNAFYGDNYDPETGRELLLEDVVKDMDSFRSTVKEKLYEQYPGEEFGDLDEALKDLSPAAGDASIWTMDYSGITMYFNPYYLTSYASGMQVITVPFNENPGIFVEEYLDVPEVYAQQIDSRIPAVFDVNGDGMNEAIIVTEETPEEEKSEDGEESGYKNWVIYCGGDMVTISDYCYYAQFYLVRANDQYYLHVFETGDNSYSLFTVVDLKTMKNDADKRFNAGLMLFDTQYESDDYGFRAGDTEDVYTDPECVYLSSMMETLGSNTGIKMYGIGKDGWLYSKDEYYEVYTSMVYTAKTDMKCTEVDVNGNRKGTGSIKSGKYYRLVRTDNKTYADIQELDADEVMTGEMYPYIWANDDDGLNESKPVYRLNVDISEYPHTIEGVPEEEIFDGILYAG